MKIIKSGNHFENHQITKSSNISFKDDFVILWFSLLCVRWFCDMIWFSFLTEWKKSDFVIWKWFDFATPWPTLIVFFHAYSSLLVFLVHFYFTLDTKTSLPKLNEMIASSSSMVQVNRQVESNKVMATFWMMNKLTIPAARKGVYLIAILLMKWALMTINTWTLLSIRID